MSSDVGLVSNILQPPQPDMRHEMPPENSSTIGLVDIGSNSIRLVIYRSDGRLPHPQFNERDVCRLGEEVGRTGCLGEAQMQLAFKSLHRFAEIARSSQVDALEVFATEAVRRAQNSSDFINKAEAILKTPVRVISGSEEAIMSALGICSGFHNPVGLVADLGGGSLELIPVETGKIIQKEMAVSLPCGYLNKFSTKDVSRHLDTISWLKTTNSMRLYVVGGVWRAIATAYIYKRKPRIDIVHGFSMSLDQLHQMMDKIEARDGEIHGIPNARRPSMTQAIRVIRALIAKLSPSEIVFSAFGVREGILFDRLDLNLRYGDPLMEGAKEYAMMTTRFPHQGKVLARKIAPLIAHLKPSYQRLTVACCYLCDLVWLEHPDHRSRLALEKMLGLSVVGISLAERVWMAAVLYTRYEGYMPKRKDFLALIPEADRKHAKSIGVLLRLFMTFSGGIPKVLEHVEIEETKKGFTLHIDDDLIGSGDLVKRRVANVNRSLPYKLTLS